MRVGIGEIDGVVLHEPTIHADDRGSFVKHYSSPSPLAARQVCSSFNARRGTIRGMHLQVEPHGETKLVWCTAGRIWDVVVDTREEQPTYGAWGGVLLDSSESRLLEIPAGVAHGYQALVDVTSVAYVIDGEHVPSAARTLAWNDPTIRIEWPLPVGVMSENDLNGQSWPLS